MHWLDFVILGLYMVGVVSIGYYHFRRNKSAEDYYVGSRSISAHHVGLSIVATDVGGGFSIGLGGLGFAMGLSGSWLLFTGLAGAWLSAVFIIPRIKAIDAENNMMTYPDFLRFRFNGRVALLAALISGIGYLGFTGAQLLAGAKLAAGTMFSGTPFGLDPVQFSLYVIAGVAIGYTVIGGLKAVIYTDTVQWIILLSGLILITIPVTLWEIGGFSTLTRNLPREFFTLTNISWATVVNWMVTIVPIWLVAMTLYQRMYACKDEREAKKAWYIAGVFEYPVMAFVGVILGMCARYLFPTVEAELGLPTLIREILPIGVTGIVVAAYFSAIMSTADSCLMASSGNFVNDLIQPHVMRKASERVIMRTSMVATLVIGVLAVVLASRFQTVLGAILCAYSFMVSGLFVPTLGAYFWRRSSSAGAFWGMLCGGMFTITVLATNMSSRLQALLGLAGGMQMPYGLDPSLFGILISLIVFTTVSLLVPDTEPDVATAPAREMERAS